MSDKSAWSPYGLEAIRVAYLRRRRILAFLIALGLAGLWGMLSETTTTSSTEVFVNGRRANTIDLDIPDQRSNDGPVTVEILPGRVTRAESGNAAGEASPLQQTGAPVFERQAPIPYAAYLIMYGPFALLGAAFLFLAKRRGKHDEVNYGIFKGAMPLEMLSASMASQVYTGRHAKSSLFGKRRDDYLTNEVVSVERVPQEES